MCVCMWFLLHLPYHIKRMFFSVCALLVSHVWLCVCPHTRVKANQSHSCSITPSLAGCNHCIYTVYVIQRAERTTRVHCIRNSGRSRNLERTVKRLLFETGVSVVFRIIAA